MDLLNDAPQQVVGGQTPGIRPLFHSRRDIALIKDTCIKPGFGLLRAGTILSASVTDGLMVPNPEDGGTGDIDAARPRLLANAVDTESTVVVSEADAAKFRVGDDVVINNNVPAYQDLGPITAIAAAVNGQVTITVTNSISGATFTTANNAAISHKTAATTPFYAAACLLDRDVNTGTAANDPEAPTSVVFGNAMVYTVNLFRLSAKAITDLGAVQHGIHTILK